MQRHAALFFVGSRWVREAPAADFGRPSSPHRGRATPMPRFVRFCAVVRWRRLCFGLEFLGCGASRGWLVWGASSSIWPGGSPVREVAGAFGPTALLVGSNQVAIRWQAVGSLSFSLCHCTRGRYVPPSPWKDARNPRTPAICYHLARPQVAASQQPACVRGASSSPPWRY